MSIQNQIKDVTGASSPSAAAGGPSHGDDSPNSAQSSGPSLWCALCDLIRSWWRVDRIRASPSEGRLLRLNSGSILEVGKLRAEVIDRHVVTCDINPAIAYDCRSATTTVLLLIKADQSGRIASCIWEVDGAQHSLAPDEIRIVV